MDRHSLLDITLTLNSIEQAIVENNGELTPELEVAISSQVIAREKKIDSYHAIMERCSSIETELKSKTELLTRMIKNVSNIKDKLKHNLKDAMLLTNTNELTGELIRFKLSQGANKLVIQHEGLIPISYFTERTVLELDKDKLKNDLENGIHVDGCHLEKINSLRVYPAISSKKIGDKQL